MNKTIKDIISKLEGNVISIGTSESLVSVFKNNDKITECYLLDEISRGKTKDLSGSSIRKINIKKLKKKFKNIDYIVCSYEQIRKYLRNFIGDSSNISKKKIYFYGKIDDYELSILKKRYQNYNCDLKVLYDSKNKVIEISTKNSKTGFLKDKFYKIKYIFENISELISSFLTS